MTTIEISEDGGTIKIISNAPPKKTNVWFDHIALNLSCGFIAKYDIKDNVMIITKHNMVQKDISNITLINQINAQQQNHIEFYVNTIVDYSTDHSIPMTVTSHKSKFCKSIDYNSFFGINYGKPRIINQNYNKQTI